MSAKTLRQMNLLFQLVLLSSLLSVQAWTTRPFQFSTPVGSKADHTTRASHRMATISSWSDDDPSTSSFSVESLHLDEAQRQKSKSPFEDVNTRAVLLGVIALGTPGLAEAATTDVIPSALAAYGHYLAVITMTASIVTERLTVKADMTIEEEKLLSTADIVTGIAGVLLLVSGYYRATMYGKGWEFYSHEPLFWLKISFLGIFGGLSLFPTITIIQRAVKIQQEGTIEPMSEELATRMKKVLNAELSALAVIPLTATLMARGVGYINDFPTEIVGPLFTVLITGGASYKYVNDALNWKEPSTKTTE